MATSITEPIPIFKVAHRYLLYDVNTVTYLRKEHNISGVLIGSLPQASQQNVFLGLPLELMPEEARLLVEKGVGSVVDDVASHKRNFLGGGLSAEERKTFQAALRKQGLGAAQEANKKSGERKKAALKKIGAATENWNDIPEDMLKPAAPKGKKAAVPAANGASSLPAEVESSLPVDAKESAATSSAAEDELLFASPANSFPMHSIRSRASSNISNAPPEPYAVTPTTSYPPLQSQKPPSGELRSVPTSYPLYKYLHEQKYFMAPGLRFGCQYMAYPGDPLRFHSHFLCNGMDWDQEFDLLDLVGGGRLGTGVKKGFLVGGEERMGDGEKPEDANAVRAFCIEWGGM